jgi:Tfp pilus assembly protein PilN
MPGIIPKKKKQASPRQNLYFYLAFGFLGVVILGYVALILVENSTSNNLLNLEESISQVGTTEEIKVERSVLSQKKTIDKFADLLQNHKKSATFFQLLEENIHPDVWFTELELEPSTASADLSGRASNFQTLGQQLLMLRGQPMIKNINLTNLALSEQGDAEFTISLSLDEQLFR